MELMWSESPIPCYLSLFSSVDIIGGLCGLRNRSALRREELNPCRLRQGDGYYGGGRTVQHWKLEGTLAPTGARAGWPTVTQGRWLYISGGSGEIARGDFTERYFVQYGPSGVALIAQGRWPNASSGDKAYRTTKFVGINLTNGKSYRRTWSSSGRIPMRNYDESTWATALAAAYSYAVSPYGNLSTDGYVLQIPRVETQTVFSFADHLFDLSTEVFADAETERSLYAAAVDGQKAFTGNLIGFASKLSSIGTSARSILSLATDPLDPKAWASAWLAGRFSDRLMLKNAEDLSRAILWRLTEVCPSSDQTSRAVLHWSAIPSLSAFERVDGVEHCRLVCSNDSSTALMTAIKKLYEWDAWPTLENAWDLVPFSFVVDWFLQVGSILDNVDRMVYEQYLAVRLYERSSKLLLKPSASIATRAFSRAFDPSGLTVSYYRRSSASPPDLGVLDGWDLSLPSPTNVGDAIALAVQLR